MNAATRVQLPAALAWLMLMTWPASALSRPGSGLAGSPHDLTKMGSSAYQSDRNADMCIYCHVPQNGSASDERPQWNERLTTSTAIWNSGNRTSGLRAQDSMDRPPLWNHDLTNSAASYRMYENGRGAPQRGPKASQAITNGMTPGSTSLLCLSCHDGSVAGNSYSNAAGLTGLQSNGGATIGVQHAIGKYNSLENHHPIGFDYDAVRAADREIRPADSAMLGTAGSVRDHLYGVANTQMECGTCHSVHNTGNTGETLLWRSDMSSRLCLTCHDKGTNPVAMSP